MSLDAEESRLTRLGRVVIEGGEVIVEGFEGQNCSCRDIAVLAAAHAIAVLSDQILGIERLCFATAEKSSPAQNPTYSTATQKAADVGGWITAGKRALKTAQRKPVADGKRAGGIASRLGSRRSRTQRRSAE